MLSVEGGVGSRKGEEEEERREDRAGKGEKGRRRFLLVKVLGNKQQCHDVLMWLNYN